MSDYIDLRFRGSDRVIATAVLSGPDGVTLVDPGPTSCLPALEDGLRQRGLTLRDVRALLITHIHLDHAGATGTIVERVPAIRVYVHERGAPHMIDPARLLASATRLYGDQMDTLWGAFLPVPAANVNVLQGGERVAVAGTTLRVAYTPGHAKHTSVTWTRPPGRRTSAIPAAFVSAATICWRRRRHPISIWPPGDRVSMTSRRGNRCRCS